MLALHYHIFGFFVLSLIASICFHFLYYQLGISTRAKKVAEVGWGISLIASVFFGMFTLALTVAVMTNWMFSL